MTYNYDVMIKNIEKNLLSNKLEKTIKKFWDKTNSLYVASIFIGEVFTYFFINKDYDDFNNYLDDMFTLYNETIDFKKYNYTQLKNTYKNISNVFDEVILDTEDFKIKRAKIICKSIAKRLGINKNIDELTKEEKIKIKDDFIFNYVTDGFVIHSFHSALLNSIKEKGLSSGERIWDDSEIMGLGNIFFEKGAYGALGGYNYYNGQGLYFEHNYRKLYSHAIYSPEWFNFFTSSNHLTGFPDIDRAPFILKNYDACKQNVLDLCNNVGIKDNLQIDSIIKIFNKYFKMFESKNIMVALIPKRVVKKDTVNQEVLNNKNLLETIIYLIDDINNEYKEHFGNVWNGNIPSNKFYIVNLPILEKFITIDNFIRETKDELFELSAVEHMKRHLARILNSVGETEKANKLINKKDD